MAPHPVGCEIEFPVGIHDLSRSTFISIPFPIIRGTSLIVIFVPSRDRDRQPIDQEYWVGRIIQGFVSSKATENDMATTVAHMTKSELREMIETIIEQKLLELIGDPDEGLPIRKSVHDRLLRQKQTVVGGQRGEPLEDVARRLGLE
jgi:hypothetical protein